MGKSAEKPPPPEREDEQQLPPAVPETKESPPKKHLKKSATIENLKWARKTLAWAKKERLCREIAFHTPDVFGTATIFKPKVSSPISLRMKEDQHHNLVNQLPTTPEDSERHSTLLWIHYPEMLKYASFNVRNNREFLLSLIEEASSSSKELGGESYCDFLAHITAERKRDKDLILIAVKVDGNALGYAAKSLRNDPGT